MPNVEQTSGWSSLRPFSPTEIYCAPAVPSGPGVFVIFNPATLAGLSGMINSVYIGHSDNLLEEIGRQVPNGGEEFTYFLAPSGRLQSIHKHLYDTAPFKKDSADPRGNPDREVALPPLWQVNNN